MNRWALWAIVIVILAGCGGRPAPVQEIAAGTATIDTPASTPVPPEPPVPTSTVVPTATPVPTITPIPEVQPVAESPLPPLPAMFPKLDNQPRAYDFDRGRKAWIPEYDPATPYDPARMDLRSHDLSRLDLSGVFDDLIMSSFDDRTTWPGEQIPAGFDPARIVELGKNPGLGVRTLHEKGITGRGVGVAILDQKLLVGHGEYSGRLRMYEEINYGMQSTAEMHGPAVASIAVGQTVGVAPGADLYYIAVWFTELGGETGYTVNYEHLAHGIRRILEVNELLPEGRKIRVISIARGWAPGETGYEAVTAAVEEAQAAGLLVVYASMEDEPGSEFAFNGLGRHPLADPDAFESYGPGQMWLGNVIDEWAHRLQIPMDSRAVAGPTGEDEYAFYRYGGWSWAIPYLAGTYALAVQVDPALTPDEFLALAMETGRMIEWQGDDTQIEIGPILDPAALVAAVQAQ